MQIERSEKQPVFKQLKGIRLMGMYRKSFEAENVKRVIDSIQSNKIFEDIFQKRDGYIVLDKRIQNFNNYSANKSQTINNSLSIYFDIKQGFFSRLLSAGRPLMLFKLFETSDYKSSWEGKVFDGNLEDRFNEAIRNYDENDFIDYGKMIQKYR